VLYYFIIFALNHFSALLHLCFDIVASLNKTIIVVDYAPLKNIFELVIVMYFLVAVELLQVNRERISPCKSIALMSHKIIQER
jgi:hypothetical protein